MTIINICYRVLKSFFMKRIYNFFKNLPKKWKSLKLHEKFTIVVVLPLLILYCFLFKESAKPVLVFLRENIEWSILIASIVVVSTIFVSHWKFVNTKTWFWRKLAFIGLVLASLLVLFSPNIINLSEVQKARIRAEYQQDLDSTKKAISAQYRIDEKNLKSELGDTKSNLNYLKESFDSLILVNQKLQSRQSSATIVQKDCPDLDSLMSINEEMKDKIATLEKTKPVKASVKSRSNKLKVSYKEPSIRYCPYKHY